MSGRSRLEEACTGLPRQCFDCIEQSCFTILGVWFTAHWSCSTTLLPNLFCVNGLIFLHRLHPRSLVRLERTSAPAAFKIGFSVPKIRVVNLKHQIDYLVTRCLIRLGPVRVYLGSVDEQNRSTNRILLVSLPYDQLTLEAL